MTQSAMQFAVYVRMKGGDHTTDGVIALTMREGDAIALATRYQKKIRGVLSVTVQKVEVNVSESPFVTPNTFSQTVAIRLDNPTSEPESLGILWDKR